MAGPDPAALPKLTISFLAGDTPERYCTEYVDMLFDKFTAPHPKFPEFGKYEVGASLATLPDEYDAWFENVGYYTRRRVRRALKEGYTFERIDADKYLDDIYEINTSMSERQGREMGDAYKARPSPLGPSPEYRCMKHRLLTYGVLKDGKLYAYTRVYQVGEMCLFSTILGHGEHLKSGIMFLLIAGALEDLIPTAHTKYAMYNMHWSGTEGLRYFKEQMGFAPYLVKWVRGDETALDRFREKVAIALKPARDGLKKLPENMRQTTSRARKKAGLIKRKLLRQNLRQP